MTDTTKQWLFILDNLAMFHDMNDEPPQIRNHATLQDVRDGFCMRLQLLAKDIQEGAPMPSLDDEEAV